jgi:hypothetical protein
VSPWTTAATTDGGPTPEGVERMRSEPPSTDPEVLPA